MGVSAPELPAEERAGRAQAAAPRIPALLEAFDETFAAARCAGDPRWTLTGEVGDHAAAPLRDLLGQASAPYDEFVYGEASRAAKAGESLLAGAAGEGAPPHLRLLCEGDRLLGCVAALSWQALGQARLRASCVLARAGLLTDPALRARLRLAAGSLLQPQAGDAYLARIAVSAEARRQGVGRRLLEALGEGAQRAGLRRVVLEVSTSSPGALGLYRSLGYEELGRRRVVASDAAGPLEYAHMARLLQPLPPLSVSSSDSGSGSGSRP